MPLNTTVAPQSGRPHHDDAASSGRGPSCSAIQSSPSGGRGATRTIHVTLRGRRPCGRGRHYGHADGSGRRRRRRARRLRRPTRALRPALAAPLGAGRQPAPRAADRAPTERSPPLAVGRRPPRRGRGRGALRRVPRAHGAPGRRRGAARHREGGQHAGHLLPRPDRGGRRRRARRAGGTGDRPSALDVRRGDARGERGGDPRRRRRADQRHRGRRLAVGDRRAGGWEAAARRDRGCGPPDRRRRRHRRRPAACRWRCWGSPMG